MEESWRTVTGIMRGLPRRRSVEDRSSSSKSRSVFSGGAHSESVGVEDYSDVFGGPPRTLLVHKFSNSGSSYDEIFLSPEFIRSAPKGDRTFPVFRIPARNEGFYSDIFGSDDDRKSRERSGSLSKANSSSALSSEELSPYRPTIGDDVVLSSFASKLRPMSVPWKSNSSATPRKPDEYSIKQGVPFFSCNAQSFEIQYQVNEYRRNFKSSPLGFSKRVSSPETVSLESNSYQGVKGFTDDWELNSPFSAVSPVCQESEANFSAFDHMLSEQIIERDDYDDDDDEVMSSYVIDINSNLRREECEASDMDEAIAWAKERFQSRSSDEVSSTKNDGNEQTVEIEGSPDTSEYHNVRIVKFQPPKKLPSDMEKLDTDIIMWSSDQETDIRALLSTLHHILWPESGWHAIPFMNLIENSHVKKAYQKARLCLHPDKLQQKRATLLQKYLAEKAFSILQDAWAAFISEDVSF